MDSSSVERAEALPPVGLQSSTPLELPEPYPILGWGVMGPCGNIWSDKYFDTPEEALEHVRAFWRRATKPETFADRIRGYSAIPVMGELRAHSMECAVPMPSSEEQGLSSAEGRVGNPATDANNA